MELTLSAEVRTEKGTGAAHKLRREGQIPAVVYAKASARSLSLSRRDVSRLVSHAGTGRLINLLVKEGTKANKTPVLIKEVQRHPVKGEIIHVDFLVVALDKAITTHVHIHLMGEEKRTNDGAFIEQYLREIEISCLPTEIPECFEVDISKLVIGGNVHVRDLTAPAGVKFVTPADDLIVSVSAPAVEEVVVAPVVEAAEPAAVEKKEEE